MTIDLAALAKVFVQASPGPIVQTSIEPIEKRWSVMSDQGKTHTLNNIFNMGLSQLSFSHRGAEQET